MKLSKWLIIPAIVILIVGTWWVASKNTEYVKALAIAEEKEKANVEKERLLKDKEEALQKVYEQFSEELKKSQKEILALSNQQRNLVTQIGERNKKTDEEIKTVTDPKRESVQVVKDVEKYYQVTPEVVDNKIFFTSEQTQLLVADKINSLRLEENFKDTQEQLSLEEHKTTNLTNDLQKAIDNLNKSNDIIKEYKDLVDLQKATIESYKVAAKKTKWQRVKEVGFKVVEYTVIGLVVSSIK